MLDDVTEIMKELRQEPGAPQAQEPEAAAQVQEPQEAQAYAPEVAPAQEAEAVQTQEIQEVQETSGMTSGVHKAHEMSERSGVYKELEVKDKPTAAEPVPAESTKPAEPMASTNAPSTVQSTQEPASAETPASAEAPASTETPASSEVPASAAIPDKPKAPEQKVTWQRKGKVLSQEMIRKLDKRQARRRKIDKAIKLTIATIIAAIFAFLFLMPIVLTITNSFMGSAEIASNYGSVFATNANGGKVYISEKVNLKFIPDIVSFSQYTTVLFKSPQYLLKFWNSVVLVGPIVLFQIIVATLASYGFARYTGKLRAIIFFSYVILMLMPYQVTLVPNYLVSDKLKILDTYWSIWLPGIFSPFAVYLLTKFMRRIPQSMIEAAQIDGAGEWQIYRRICLPLCKGAICSAAILVFIDYWNMVEQPLILLADGEKHPLSVFLSKINSGEVGLAFAVATIYMVPTLLVFLYGEEYLVDGITYQGGVKG